MIQKSILDLPDEIIEEIMTFLTFNDLLNLRNTGKLLRDCAKRIIEKKTFKIAVIGPNNCAHDAIENKTIGVIEVISIIMDSIVLNDPVIPPLPKMFFAQGGTQLPNGDLLLCGETFGEHPLSSECMDYHDCDDYLMYIQGSSQWTKVGTMMMRRYDHSSVLIEDRLYITGGISGDPYYTEITSLHEQFSIDEGVKEMKKMPIPLANHTATAFGKNKMIVCGGIGNGTSDRSLIYDVEENSWTEGPSLLAPRYHHSSCAIQSDDGSTRCIIVISGITCKEKHFGGGRISRTSEILDLDNRKWVQGPELPLGLHNSACVALPRTSNFACIVIGGVDWTCTGNKEDKDNDKISDVVYGLNKKLTEWTFLGKMNGRRFKFRSAFLLS